MRLFKLIDFLYILLITPLFDITNRVKMVVVPLINNHETKFLFLAKGP